MGSSFTGPLLVDGFDVVAGSTRPGTVRGLVPGGEVWYVCNRSGVSNGDGKSPDAPLSTLFGANGALARLRNRTNFGDCIYVLPGHAENVAEADAASHTGTASGFSVVGLGTGLMRPSFTWTAATSTWLLDTAGVELANLRLFLAGANAAGSALTVAAPITVSANDCAIVNCEIYWGFDADQIVGDGIIWTGDDGRFEGNRCFAATAAVPSNTFLTLTGADRMVIRGNWIVGATDGTTRGVIDTETTACTELRIENNYVANRLASSTIALSCTANDTGIAARNFFFVNSGILPITASELEWHENYVVNGEGEAGALVGTASA